MLREWLSAKTFVSRNTNGPVFPLAFPTSTRRLYHWYTVRVGKMGLLATIDDLQILG